MVLSPPAQGQHGRRQRGRRPLDVASEEVARSDQDCNGRYTRWNSSRGDPSLLALELPLTTRTGPTASSTRGLEVDHGDDHRRHDSPHPKYFRTDHTSTGGAYLDEGIVTVKARTTNSTTCSESDSAARTLKCMLLASTTSVVLYILATVLCPLRTPPSYDLGRRLTIAAEVFHSITMFGMLPGAGIRADSEQRGSCTTTLVCTNLLVTVHLRRSRITARDSESKPEWSGIVVVVTA